MGFDLSTQGLKATVINADCEVVYNTAINFDKDLPHYGTSGGAIDLGGGVVRAPTLMFVEAVDTVLGNMRADGFDFSTVGAISGRARLRCVASHREYSHALELAFHWRHSHSQRPRSNFHALRDSPEASVGVFHAAVEKVTPADLCWLWKQM